MSQGNEKLLARCGGDADRRFEVAFGTPVVADLAEHGPERDAALCPSATLSLYRFKARQAVSRVVAAAAKPPACQYCTVPRWATARARSAPVSTGSARSSRANAPSRSPRRPTTNARLILTPAASSSSPGSCGERYAGPQGVGSEIEAAQLAFGQPGRPQQLGHAGFRSGRSST